MENRLGAGSSVRPVVLMGCSGRQFGVEEETVGGAEVTVFASGAETSDGSGSGDVCSAGEG